MKKTLSAKAIRQLINERDFYRSRFEAAVTARKKETQRADLAEAALAPLRSELGGTTLANLSMKQRLDDIMNYVTLKRPDVLKLIELTQANRAAASAKLAPPMPILVTRKRKVPRVTR